MTVTPKRLYNGVPAVGPTTVYTAPSGGAEILVIVVTNPTAGAQSVTVSVNSVPLIGGETAPAHDHLRLGGPFHLAAGDTVSVANPSGVLAVMVSGFEIT